MSVTRCPWTPPVRELWGWLTVAALLRTAPFLDIELRSGDLLVFGGPNRRIHHGVPKVATDTAPEGLDLPPGRLSITIRDTGLAP